VAVADSSERLDAEEKAIQKPMGGSSSDAVLLKTVKGGEEKIEADVKSADKRGELWPAQSKQPAVDVAPFPGVGIDFDELDLTRSNRNFVAPASPLANFSTLANSLVHEPM